MVVPPARDDGRAFAEFGTENGFESGAEGVGALCKVEKGGCEG